MVSRAIARYIRISPRKTRKVIDLIRGLKVVDAEALLNTINKRPTDCIKRLLRSAVDSADKKFNLSPADLYISSVRADQGPMLKRYRAASMGRATMIKHRTTHITLELERIEQKEKKVVEQRVPSKEQRAKSKEQKEKGKEHRAKSKEQRAKSKEKES